MYYSSVNQNQNRVGVSAGAMLTGGGVRATNNGTNQNPSTNFGDNSVG